MERIVGRPPALTDRQCAEIGKRLVMGESMIALAKEFKVGVTTLKRRFSDRLPKIRKAAVALAQAEVMVTKLEVTDQVVARSFTEYLVGITDKAVRAAEKGMATADKLQGMALAKVNEIEALGGEATVEDMRLPDAYLTVALKASTLGTQLMQNNRDAGKESDKATLGSLLGQTKVVN